MNSQQSWKTVLVILSLSSILMSVSYTMLIPFLPMYLMQELGVAQSDVNIWSGVIFSASFLISGIMAPIWGAMADKKSRKLMAVRAAVLLAISYALGGIVQDPWQLLAMRCFQGFAAGLWPACLAIMASNAPRDKVGLCMGTMQGAMTAGGVLGPLAGGVLAEAFDMRTTFFLGGAALFVITLLLIFFIKEPKRKPQEKKESASKEKTNLLKIPVVQRMLLCAGIVQLTILLQQPVMPLYVGELQGSMDRIVFVTGLLFSIVGVSGVIASPVWGVIGQRWGFRPALYTALFGTAIFGMIQAIPDTLVPFGIWRFIGGAHLCGHFPRHQRGAHEQHEPRRPRPHFRPFLCGATGRERHRPDFGRSARDVVRDQVRRLLLGLRSPAARHLPLSPSSERRNVDEGERSEARLMSIPARGSRLASPKPKARTPLEKEGARFFVFELSACVPRQRNGCVCAVNQGKMKFVTFPFKW